MQKFTLIIACLLFFACAGKKPVGIPETILPKQKMAEVMLDIHLLEATMNLNSTAADKVPPGNPTPNFDVLKKNNISKKQYDESFDFYSQHPALLNEVYDLVLNDLSKMQAQVLNSPPRSSQREGAPPHKAK